MSNSPSRLRIRRRTVAAKDSTVEELMSCFSGLRGPGPELPCRIVRALTGEENEDKESEIMGPFIDL